MGMPFSPNGFRPMSQSDRSLPVLYDITDAQTARATLNSIYGLNADRLSNLTEDELYEIAENHKFLANPNEPLMIRVRHITTSGNNCADIKRDGLLPTSEVLRRGTELSTFLKTNLGIVITDDGRLQLRGKELNPKVDSAVLNKINGDDRVNGYAFISERVDDYDLRPEIIADLASSFNRPSLIEKWTIGKRPFAIWFEADAFREVSNINGATLEDAPDGLRDYYRGLLEIAVSVALGEYDGNIPVCLHRRKSIEATRITVMPFEQR